MIADGVGFSTVIRGWQAHRAPFVGEAGELDIGQWSMAPPRDHGNRERLPTRAPNSCFGGRLNPALFRAAVTARVRTAWPDRPEFIAIDGKTSRRSHDRRGAAAGPIHRQRSASEIECRSVAGLRIQGRVA